MMDCLRVTSLQIITRAISVMVIARLLLSTDLGVRPQVQEVRRTCFQLRAQPFRALFETLMYLADCHWSSDHTRGLD